MEAAKIEPAQDARFSGAYRDNMIALQADRGDRLARRGAERPSMLGYSSRLQVIIMSRRGSLLEQSHAVRLVQ
jgi:hypothetical protein